MDPILVWFENELRTRDHPALSAAMQTGRPVVGVFCWDGGEGWADGAASRWWLHHSLSRHAEVLAGLGIPLVVRTGNPEFVLPELVASTGASDVFWMARADPRRAARDARVAASLPTPCSAFAGTLLHNPDTLLTGGGNGYRVFTPFFRRFGVEVTPVLSEQIGTGPKAHGPQVDPSQSVTAVANLGLLPRRNWASGIDASWTPGEAGAGVQLGGIALSRYERERDDPSAEGTSRLSPHLHFGELAPSRVWAAAAGHSAYRRQLAWREFAHHVLHHFPQTSREPLRPEFLRFPWRHDSSELSRWQRGRTGYPLVDAGMRQLWETGWMHNRVRMVVASFLTKHLLHSWLHGQDWFNDTLVDADLANNVFGWQWAGGCGADAMPFFRIFNPIAQGKKFDPYGRYVKTWIPELRQLSASEVHEPWRTSVVPGSYPAPVVAHAEARARALGALKTIKR